MASGAFAAAFRCQQDGDSVRQRADERWGLAVTGTPYGTGEMAGTSDMAFKNCQKTDIFTWRIHR